MNGLSFVNPYLLWAMPLAAAPLVIYFLMRFRAVTVPWGADYVLQRAIQRLKKTRSLDQMRRALRDRARGTRRAGLVCSAQAKRLRADGLWPEFPHLDETIVANWFLLHWPDVRASDALEVPATQFACQGLELDLVGLCWGNDLIRTVGAAAWTARAFRGKAWQAVRDEAKRAYQVNTYRVLLTRARYETVIWVPRGDAEDVTRDPASFDGIADFLLQCGATWLDDEPVHPASAPAMGTLL